MNETAHLRTVITGLLGFAAAEEETLLSFAAADYGDARNWGVLPVLAHNAEFKEQQSERVAAVCSGRTPPEFGEIDHGSAAVYAGYAARGADAVRSESRQVTVALLDGVRALADVDLTDPARHGWLRGRPLWLQVVVRGFWHPTGHVADWYLRHGLPERAVALHSHALATARYLGAPDQAAGMAAYSLACAQAQAGAPQAAGRALAEAIALNPDVRTNAGRDPDLAPLRDAGQLAGILAG